MACPRRSSRTWQRARAWRSARPGPLPRPRTPGGAGYPCPACCRTPSSCASTAGTTRPGSGSAARVTRRCGAHGACPAARTWIRPPITSGRSIFNTFDSSNSARAGTPQPPDARPRQRADSMMRRSVTATSVFAPVLSIAAASFSFAPPRIAEIGLRASSWSGKPRTRRVSPSSRNHRKMRRYGWGSSDSGAQTTPGASSAGTGGCRASARGSIASSSRAEVWRAACESLRFPGSDCGSVPRPGSSAMIRSSRVREPTRLLVSARATSSSVRVSRAMTSASRAS
jgi:hypothetical protein